MADDRTSMSGRGALDRIFAKALSLTEGDLASFYIPMSGLREHGHKGLAYGDYLVRAAQYPDTDEARAVLPTHLEAWHPGSLGEAAAKAALGRGSPRVWRDGDGAHWLLCPADFGAEEDGPGIGIARLGPRTHFDDEALARIEAEMRNEAAAFLSRVHGRQVEIWAALTERLARIDPSPETRDNAAFDREMEAVLGFLAERFSCQEMTLCLADEALLAEPSRLRSPDKDRLFRIRWSTMPLGDFKQTTFCAIDDDGPQGWVLMNRARHYEPGFPVLYRDRRASLRQVPPIDMSQRERPDYLRPDETEDVVICPLIVDGALFGFLRAGFRQRAPYVLGTLTARALEASGQNVVRLAQSRAAAQRSRQRAAIMQRALEALQRLNMPPSTAAADPLTEKEIAAAALDRFLGVWEADGPLAAMIEVRFREDDETMLVRAGEPRGVTRGIDFALKSAIYTSIGGRLRVMVRAGEREPELLEPIGKLFADRIALKLAVRRLDAQQSGRIDQLRLIAEREREIQNTLHEANHQITTPIRVALIKVEELLDAAHRKNWTDTASAAGVVAACVRRVYRISRAADVFEALHSGRDLPSRHAAPLAALAVEKRVRAAVNDATTLGAGEASPPKIRLEVADNIHDADWGATRVDPDVLDQIVFALLENAYKYSVQDSWIDVSVGSTGSGRPFIRVSNIGERITSKPAELVKRGFRDPGAFMRSGEGAGLGLWIVHEIMRRLSGTLMIEPSTSREPRHRFTLLFRKDGS